jgi:CRISPR-associated endonuclease/helicase Cas3
MDSSSKRDELDQPESWVLILIKSMLSRKARSLWAKKSRNGDLLWLPLPVHLSDTAEVARLLWHRWVPDGVKRRMAAGIKDGTEENAERLLVFLAAAHDIGKATPVFASKECGYRELDERIFDQIIRAGLPLEQQSTFMYRSKTPHSLASQVLLHNAGCPVSVAVVLGAHHGKPPDLELLLHNFEIYRWNYVMGEEGETSWHEVQQELIRYALALSDYGAAAELPELDAASQVLFSGLLIVADWIASDPDLFPYVRLDDRSMPDSRQRAVAAWRQLGFTSFEVGNSWMNTDLYKMRFGIRSPYPVQNAVREVLEQVCEPGIMVIEAPMGAGKTEAALVAAEILMDKTNRRGLFFALPTQATSDGIFPRVTKWVSRLETEEAQSIRLMHGKAQFNSTFQNLANGRNIAEDEEGVYVHEWFTGRKRAMLDDFVVGTIDQLLMAALKQKHVMLRHLGLANKVVIIDECHAFDAYMNCYLERALNWLGAYGVPVIVLSATLPAEKRKMVIEAYCGKKLMATGQRKVRNPLEKKANDHRSEPPSQEEPSWWTASRAYPLITYTDGIVVRQAHVPSGELRKQVDILLLDDDAIADKLSELLMDGGCAGVIVNTVRRAQELARTLMNRFGDNAVLLIHSRFVTLDRMKTEAQLMKELGKPGSGRTRPLLRIVVGTQVLEQSLDIDFDVLITDLCPIDLLLQRIGRLHRHERPRPPRLRRPLCFVTGAGKDGVDSASAGIYSRYLLMRTKARLRERMLLPDDIPDLVQDVYDMQCSLLPDTEQYRQAESEFRQGLEQKRKKADVFRIRAPMGMGDMIGWLHTDVSDQSGEASVRDTEDSIEVLLIRRTASGHVGFLPWIEGGMELDRYREPPGEIARKLSQCSVRLPIVVCGKYEALDTTIEYLEKLNRELLGAWQQSSWLRGELFLVLDEHLSAELGKYRITYHPDFGLDYTVKEEM